MAIIKKDGRKSLVNRGGGLAALRRAKSGDRGSKKDEQLVLVLDSSYSMEWGCKLSSSGHYIGRKKIVAAREAARELIMASRRSDVGIVQFSTDGRMLCLLDEGRERCLMSLDRYEPDGGTQIKEGLRVALDVFELESPLSVRRMVLMTDGQDRDGGHSESAMIDRNGTRQDHINSAVAKGIIIDCVAFGADANVADLTMIANATGGVVRTANDSGELVREFKRLEASVRGLLGTGE